MNNASKLYETIKDFSEPALAEILDFAEFLRQKQMLMRTDADEALLTSIVGGLENSETFRGDSLGQQFRMRDEWS